MFPLNSNLDVKHYYCNTVYGGSETQGENCVVNREYIHNFFTNIDILGKIAHCSGSISFNKSGANIDNVVSQLPINVVNTINIPIVTYQGGATGFLRLYENKMSFVGLQVSLQTEYVFNFYAYIN